VSVGDRLLGWWRDPNPIVRKELLAVLRTPLYVRSVVVSLIAVGITLVTSAVMIADSSDSSEAGKILFQLFYGTAFLVMSFVGPTFGATTIVQEREARTFDALSLSALGPRRIVAGKLAAVFIAMAFIPLVSVPMLGVATLFGGVTLGHLIVSTVYVLAFGAVGVTFGVAVSSSTDATRKAVGATVPISVVGAMFLGGLLSAVGHDFGRHHALTIDGPFFFADAYFALPFDRTYALWLVLVPLWLVLAPSSLFYAIAHGGLMEPTQDRTLPLKRWASIAAPLTLALLVLGNQWNAANASSRRGWSLFFVIASTVTTAALLFVFVGAPAEPSRRMAHERPGVFARALMPPSRVASVWFAVMLGGFSALCAPLVLLGNDPPMLLVGLWAASYTAALGGFMGLVSLRANPTTARVAGAVALFVTLVGTWLIALLLGFGAHGSLRHPPVVLALSPAWAALAAGDALVGARDPGDVRAVRDALLLGTVIYASLAAATLTAMTLSKKR
jgi:ABC-type transport system involved in multi-copper enzyme maturation permease subunit